MARVEMANEARPNKASLCEKSMELMISILKLSSLSLASLFFGRTRGQFPQPPSENGTSLASKSHKSEPKRRYDPYVIRSREQRSLYLNDREVQDVDGKATDYIRKVQEKIRHASNVEEWQIKSNIGVEKDDVRAKAIDRVKKIKLKQLSDPGTSFKGSKFVLPPPTWSASK